MGSDARGRKKFPDLQKVTAPSREASRRSARDRGILPRPLADELPKFLVGALHVGVVLGDVLAGESEELLVVRAAELVTAGAVDDATHTAPPGWLMVAAAQDCLTPLEFSCIL
jgi:hypothetical protein